MQFFRLNEIDSNALAYRSEPFTTTVRLREFRAHFGGTTQDSEDMTVTIESEIDSAYDTVIYRIDPSVASTVDISNTDFSQLIVPGDRMRVDYANTAGVVIGWQLLFIAEA